MVLVATHLTFGYHFNKKINITRNVTHLKIGRWYNQSLIIQSNVIYLCYTHYLNQKLNIYQNIIRITKIKAFAQINFFNKAIKTIKKN